MPTPSFDIATDSPGTFAAGAWLSDKTDDPNGPVASEADSATTCAAVWANGVDEALIQINQVFQGTRAIDGPLMQGGYRTLAANAGLTLATTDSVVELSSSNTSHKAATMTATYAGHCIRVALTVYSSTGSYTFACSRGATVGTVTLNAVGAWVDLVYSGSTWKVVGLSSAGAAFA